LLIEHLSATFILLVRGCGKVLPNYWAENVYVKIATALLASKGDE